MSYKTEIKEVYMPGGMSLLDYVMGISKNKITKEEFGRIMHDPNATQDEIDNALKALEDCDGYENLAD